ncbi:MAG: hypothetical protein Q8N94_05935 [Methanoregula sp.]|nr:hypothetical protein [Methanoregula sp.]
MTVRAAYSAGDDPQIRIFNEGIFRQAPDLAGISDELSKEVNKARTPDPWQTRLDGGILNDKSVFLYRLATEGYYCHVMT